MSTKQNIFQTLTRRDWLKSLGGLSLFGAVWSAGASFSTKAKRERNILLQTLNIKASAPPPTATMEGSPLRIGIIGFGGRGEHLVRSLGYATTEWLEEMSRAEKENPADTRLKEFKDQENLNIRLTGVCDVFDVHANKALQSFNGNGNTCKRYRTATEMINSGEVDAVVIA
ncbi:MAG: gfo/Idh/MocA family oxidoreductase, partial [Cyclobacteriaceae bacterium]